MGANQLTIRPTFIKKITLFIVCAPTFVATTSIFAKDYMVEVVVFENSQPSQATESQAYTAIQTMKSSSSAWRIEPTMLNEDVISIQESPDYEFKYHFSWGVESLPYEESANYTLLETDSQGYIKIYSDHLLFTNIDLDYKGFRMKEKRRLKLNEKHYFDHPKFGLLMQVSRLPEKALDDDLLESDNLIDEQSEAGTSE